MAEKTGKLGSTDDPVQRLVKRIFIAQVVLLALAAVLVGTALAVDVGFFWFTFLAGVLGASVAFLRRVQVGPPALAKRALHSWSTTLMPLLYGGIMAAVAYFLFMSRVLSGVEGGGLLATNLFPDFGTAPPKEGDQAMAINELVATRPRAAIDAGKLLVWCFLAGYSESFVTGVLKRLEKGSSGE